MSLAQSDGRYGAGALDQCGRRNADHQADKGVGGEREQFLGVVADRRFEAISDSADGCQQQIDQCDDQQPRQPLARSGCRVVG
jgi:hypothetical protein